MLKLIIKGEPMAKQSFRVAVRKTKAGKTFIAKYQPKKVMENESNLKWDIKSQLPRGFKPFDCALEVTVLFVFPPLKSWSKAEKQAFKDGIVYKETKPDLTDNLFKAVGDAMNGLVYVDDARIVKNSLEKIYGDVPRIELTIQPVIKREAKSQPNEQIRMFEPKTFLE